MVDPRLIEEARNAAISLRAEVLTREHIDEQVGTIMRVLAALNAREGCVTVGPCQHKRTAHVVEGTCTPAGTLCLDCMAMLPSSPSARDVVPTAAWGRWKNNDGSEQCNFCGGFLHDPHGTPEGHKADCPDLHRPAPDAAPAQEGLVERVIQVALGCVEDNRKQYPEDPPRWSDCGCAGPLAQELADALTALTGDGARRASPAEGGE